MTDRTQLIADALDLWAPSYPRRAGRQQNWVRDHGATTRRLLDAEEPAEDSPFISVYSFPRGHTKEDAIPEIDTLFIDFDFEGGDYESGSGDREAWQRDLSHLLVRARQVASVIEEGGRSDAWRASLSGHKGVHLFLDFPTLDAEMGSFDQYVGGLNEYATDLVSELSDKTGIADLDDYVDVTSSDLGRLCRVPNTLHGGATASFGEDRYCVPVTIEELASLTVDDYEEMTREPREVPWDARSPNHQVGDIVAQYIQTATPGRVTYGQSTGSSTVDWGRVKRYKQRSNDQLSLQDAKLLTSDMPCVWAFHSREDKFQHGNQSHEMESHCIAKLLQNHFPIPVIHEFLSNVEEYDEQYTQQRIEELIARDFNPYSTEKLLRRAPEFCGYDWCARCQSVIEENEELQRQFN